MDKSALFTDHADDRRADPQLCEILVDRMTVWNQPLAYALSALVVFAVGFLSATVA